jgi:hypothetical protein
MVLLKGKPPEFRDQSSEIRERCARTSRNGDGGILLRMSIAAQLLTPDP